MFNTREEKQKLKSILVISSVISAILLLILIIYGVFAVRPKNINRASELGQYYEFNSNDLPSGNGSIQKTYKSNDAESRNLPKLDLQEEHSNNIAVEAPKQLPKISIIVTNLGLNHLSTELALKLPTQVALGFMPYTNIFNALIHKAREDGHEIFIYMPFETQGYPNTSPGQMPLLLSLSDSENIHRMNQLLAPFDGISGIYGRPDEVFTSDYAKIGAIMTEILAKGQKILMSSGSEYQPNEAKKHIIKADIIIDQELTILHIKQQLDKLVTIAKERGHAVGYASSYPLSIYTLQAWLPTLVDLGIELVPISVTTTGE